MEQPGEAHREQDRERRVVGQRGGVDRLDLEARREARAELDDVLGDEDRVEVLGDDSQEGDGTSNGRASMGESVPRDYRA